jgi:hypothetical protein
MGIEKRLGYMSFITQVMCLKGKKKTHTQCTPKKNVMGEKYKISLIIF